jgi:threonine aldolase
LHDLERSAGAREPRRGFASDNAAPVHPKVLESIARVNSGHTFGYGHDDYTRAIEARFEDLLGEGARAFFVFNGSAANVLCLRAACRPWQGAICADVAHMNTDEGGAPEVIGGIKLRAAPTVDGKLTIDAIDALTGGREIDEHSVHPRVLSITQSTELGTVYTIDEVRGLAAIAHDRGMLLHVDGARIANAAAALKTSLAELITAAGVDLLSFGGTKNGMLAGEAVVVLPRAAGEITGLEYLRKQTLQLASKMRFIAAQFDALLTDELWRANAEHANAMAARLAAGVASAPRLAITRPVQANVVFATLPAAAREALMRRFDFYTWDGTIGEVRWMCAWDTTEADVDQFAAAVVDECARFEP